MTDYHTHILPDMDDGAKNVEISLQMLRMEQEQGVDTVALTSHFYRDREPVSSYLKRRSKAYDQLRRAMEGAGTDLPRCLLGAEVAWTPNMMYWEDLDSLCYEGTDHLLVELPFVPWNRELFHQLYDLMNRTGFTPVIAHIDRYWGTQDRGAMAELFSMGLPVQISADALLRFSTRGRAVRLLQKGVAQMVISDAHGVAERSPNVGGALEILRRKSPHTLHRVTEFELL